MLQQVLQRLTPQARSLTCLVLKRNIAASSVVYAKAQDLHPVQKLYVDKIREYAKKSSAAGGGMVDADPEIKKEIDNETSRLHKMFGGGDLTQFPDIKFEEINFDAEKK